jgi:hypothetical protein
MKIHLCFAAMFCFKLVEMLCQDTTSHLHMAAILHTPVEAKEANDPCRLRLTPLSDASTS